MEDTSPYIYIHNNLNRSISVRIKASKSSDSEVPYSISGGSWDKWNRERGGQYLMEVIVCENVIFPFIVEPDHEYEFNEDYTLIDRVSGHKIRRSGENSDTVVDLDQILIHNKSKRPIKIRIQTPGSEGVENCFYLYPKKKDFCEKKRRVLDGDRRL